MLERTLIVVKNAIEAKRLRTENVEFRRQLSLEQQITGESVQARALRQQIKLMAPTNGRVLIYGESGSGKELIARAIHAESLRSDRVFVELNCAAIPEDYIESELFGYRNSAISGGPPEKRGTFERANGGTLFLDEIGEMPLSLQPKLLRFLEQKELQRLGSAEVVRVDARVVSATNARLLALVREGKFREDLFFRLDVVRFVMPPLRQRREDIPALLAHFIRLFSEENGVPALEIEPGAMKTLQAYSWPGNIRELRNFCENAVVLRKGGKLTEFDLDPRFRGAPESPIAAGGLADGAAGAAGTTLSVEQNEKRILREALIKSRGNRTRAAELMGISRRTLHRKLAQWPELDVMDK